MLVSLLRAIARLPLAWFHAAGAVLGWTVYLVSPTYARRLADNLASSGISIGDAEFRRTRSAAIREAGKGVAELVKVWFGPDDDISRLVRCDALDVIDAAVREGNGILFLTPHLGCFEIAALYGAQRFPITVLYRPPKLRWIEPLMLAGRGRWKAELAPANLRGVRMLYKALARGEAIGILPDQAPGAGDGEWAPFFGRPAYTMTLAARLQKATGAAVIMAFAERLPAGRGYHLHLQRVSTERFDAAALNREVEFLVRRHPAQYLWGYNRYKLPVGAAPPPAGG